MQQNTDTAKLTRAGIGAAVAMALLALLLWRVAADDAPRLVDANGDPVVANEPSGESSPSESQSSSETPTIVDDAPDESSESAGQSGVPEADGAEEEEPDSSDRPGSPIDALVEELSAFVEAERGLEFTKPVTVVVRDDDEFVDRYSELVLEEAAENEEELEISTGVLQALGILPADVSLLDATLSFGAAGVLGYYDPETEELVVRGSEPNEMLRTVIVHELVHAIDDQHFELHRPEYDDREDEVSFGFSAVVEGNARRVENAYRDTLSADEQTALSQQELALSAEMEIDFSKITFPFIMLQLAPYELGELFVDQLYLAGGQDELDAAIDEPPTTSEQVMDHHEYFANDTGLAVANPPANGEVIDEGIFGAIVWSTLFDELGAPGAEEGWNGDRYVVWAEDGRHCLMVDVALDTEAQQERFLKALNTLADSAPGDAAVEQVGELARYQACSP